MPYPIGITRNLGTWNANSRHVERMADNASYDAAHPDDTLILAGPARRAVAGTGPNGGRTMRALGMFQTFSISTSAPLQPMMGIGSARSFILRGKSQSSWSLKKVLLNGLNLLRALYHNAVEAGVNVDQFDDPAALDGQPQSNFFVNLDSELFYIPVGFGLLMRSKSHTMCGGCYIELCMIQSWGIQIGAGMPSIGEEIAGFADRVLPYAASDAMAVPRVPRYLMDAVLGLGVNEAPMASYDRPGTSGSGGLDDPNVPLAT